MTTAILIAISAMWIPVALFLLGKGEAKSTGAICAMVGAVTVAGAFINSAVFGDHLLAGLLFVHGLFYATLAYCLLTGVEDMRSVGNIALNTAIVSTIYMFLFLFGGLEVEVAGVQKVLIAQSNYLAFCCAIYAYLTYIVWLNAYGKVPAKVLAISLVIGVVLSLWVPAFWLLRVNAFPF